MKVKINKENLNEMELKSGKISYMRAVEMYIGDIVLCNNIADIDFSIFENIKNTGYYDGEKEEEDEYYQKEYHQYYLCNINSRAEDILKDTNVIISYSDPLECDVLMVDNAGTSWDYVMTDIEWEEY